MDDLARSRRNVRLLYAFCFLRDFHLWIPVWIVFLTIQRGFSLTQVTVAEGIFLIGVLALEVPTGAVADRWGRSRSLALGALCLGLATIIFAFTTSFAVLITSFLIWSVAATLMSGADMAFLYDTLKNAGNERDYERHAGRVHALGWAGAGIGTFLGGPVAALTDIRATIVMGSVTCLLTAAVAFAMWEPSGGQPEPHERPRYVSSIASAFGEVLRNGEVRTIVLLSGTAFATMEGVGYLVQPYLIDRGIEVGVLFSMLQVPTFLVGIGGGLLASRVQRRGRALMLALPAVGAGAYCALALSPGLSAYAAFPLMYGLGALLMPVATGQINRRVESRNRATVLSIHGMVGSLVLAGLAPALGFATDNSGLDLAFALGGVVTLGSLLVFGSMLLAAKGRAAPPALIAGADLPP